MVQVYKEFFHVYKDFFLPSYSDLVAYLADKPSQILVEIENAFSHLAQTYNENISEKLQEENLNKATAHLQRISLDCYKLLWAEMKIEIDAIFKSHDMRSFGLNISEAEFVSKKESFASKAREARKLEIDSVGIEPLKSLNTYGEAVELGWQILKSVDPNKAYKLKKRSKLDRFKHYLLDIVLGNIISNIVWVLFGLLIAHLLG